MAGKRYSDPLIVEALEPRILYSADSPLSVAAALVAPLDADESASYMAPAPTATLTQSATTASEQETRQRTELVFIDSAVSGAADLASQILAGNDGERSLQVFLIDVGRDGIDQVGAILDLYRNL